MIYIGEKLRSLRKEKGMTLKEVAGEEFTKGYLSQIELGKVTPSFKVLTHLAAQLKVDLAHLIGADIQLDYQLARLETLFAAKKYKGVLLESQQISTDWQSPVGVKVRLLQAKALFYLNRLSECSRLFRQLITIDRDWISPYKLEAFVFGGLALFGQQCYVKAIEIYEQGIAFAEAKGIKQPLTLSKMYLNKATAWQNLEQYEKAITEYNQTLAYARHHQIMETVLDVFIRLGYCHFKKEQLEQAKEYLEKGLQLNRILELELPQAEALLLLSLVYFAENNYQLAEEYGDQAHKLLTGLSRTEPLSKNSLVEALVILTKIYLATDRHRQAKNTLQNLITQAEKNTDLPPVTAKNIAHLCMAMGKHQAANLFFARIVN